MNTERITMTLAIGSPIALRDYQQEALAAIEQADAGGIRRLLLVLPTGSGKTIIFAELIRRRRGRALVLVHRDELARQAQDKIRMVVPEAAIGLVKAERNETGFPVIVGSVQTLVRPARLAALGTFDTIIVDEAHHAAAPSYHTILAGLGAFATEGPLVVGVTATADRADGLGLDAAFEAIVFERDLLTMIRAGYLCDLRATQIHLEADFNQLHTRAGDFIEAEAERLLLDANAPAHAVAAYQTHAAGRKVLLFAAGVSLAHEMAAAFLRAGIPAAAVDGAMPLDERRQRLAQFHQGDLRVLANCMLLVEGFDMPSIDGILIARPTKSRALYTQMIGRGTRVYPGKDDCVILDLVGATTRHELMTAASLFGVEPQALEAETVVEAVAREQFRLAHVDERARLIAQTVDLFHQRRVHWTHGQGETFVLSCGAGHIVLRPEAGAWSAVYQSRDERVVLAHCLPLAYAQGAAEDYVRALGVPPVLIDPAAPWRTRPASEKQLATLQKFRIRPPAPITAGQASDLIAVAIAERSAS